MIPNVNTYWRLVVECDLLDYISVSPLCSTP